MLRYNSTLKIHSNYNKTNIYNAAQYRATSFEWYAYYKRINDTDILNIYKYSITTSKHIQAFKDLDLNIHLIAHYKGSLDDDVSLIIKSSILYYFNSLEKLTKLLKSNRRKKSLDGYRHLDCEGFAKQLRLWAEFKKELE